MTCRDCDKEFDDFEIVVHLNDSIICTLCMNEREERSE